MIIYFNGDSNVAGTELENPSTQGFAYKLSDKLGATSFINQASHGASNNLILKRTEAYLIECERTNNFPDLVIIGWTQCNREDWYVDGQYRSISSLGLQDPDLVDSESHQYWVAYMHYNMTFLHQMSKFYNRAIHNLHLQLTHLKIPHLFFNAINPINYCNVDPELADHYKEEIVLKLNWNDRYYKPYDEINGTWRNWALENNFNQVTDGWYHFDEQCQEEWAELMYNYIKEKQLV